jgi:hypothetical protein
MRVWQAAMLAALVALVACSSVTGATRPEEPGWHVYRNSQYGYEIRYPDGYDLWATGIQGERDGSAFRIGLKEYQAPVPVLDVKIRPRTAAGQLPTLGMQVPDMDVNVRDVLVNGVAAREAQYRWKDSRDLGFVEVHMRGAVFEFTASAGTTDFHKTEWWAIISTFRFTD